MNTIAISDLRATLPKAIDEVNKKLKRLVVTVSGKPKAVVLSFDELEALEETAEILTTLGAYEKIKQGAIEARKKEGILLESLA